MNFYESRFLICGAPRSATLFTAEVFNRLGYRTGHESVFGVGYNGEPGYHPEAWDWFDGEVSHDIANHLSDVDPSWPLLHITRNPVRVITSILNLRAIARLEKEYSQDPLHEYHPARVVDFLHNHFELVRAAPNPYMRIRVEDFNPFHLRECVKHLTGDRVTEEHAAYALELRQDYNAATERLGRKHRDELEWSPLMTLEWLMNNYRPATISLFRSYNYVP